MLGAVAMVHIPVQDEDPERLLSKGLGIARSQSRRVEEAETTGHVPLGVVAWGTDDGRRVPNLHANRKSTPQAFAA